MVLKAIDPSAIANEYRQIYDQDGGWTPYYAGAKYQKGHGLGSMFSGMLKSALPLLKKGAMGLAKSAVETGLNIAKDGIEGKNLKDSFNKNLKLAGSGLLNKSLNYVASTKRNNKRKHTSTNKKSKKAKKPRVSRNNDIFS